MERAEAWGKVEAGEARARCKDYLSGLLPFQPFFSHTPRGFLVPEPLLFHPTPSPVWAGGSSGHSPSVPQLWHPGEESLYSHPFLTLALWMIPRDEAVCVSWWFWDCVCFDFFFSVCIFPRQIETKFPPL